MEPNQWQGRDIADLTEAGDPHKIGSGENSRDAIALSRMLLYGGILLAVILFWPAAFLGLCCAALWLLGALGG